MKCKKPFLKGLLEAGCGQCLPCRINKQRLWTIRLILEAGQHEHSHFVTLTYDDENLPSDGSVSVPETRLFLNRVRKAAGPFRYFIVGEYGERSWRPHYHALLFGVRDASRVEECWTKGFVHISGVGPESIGYVAGYCLKGGTNERGMRWLGKSLRPEFARMSLKPGIGACGADRVAEFLRSKEGKLVLSRTGVIPNSLRLERRFYSMGRYLIARAISKAGLSREVLARDRSLRECAELKGMSQEVLNDRIALGEGIRAGVAHRAEARFKRKSLERKL